MLAGAWAAEAVALAWLAARRRHRWSALAGATMLTLALAQVALQYLVTAFDTGPRSVPNDELFALAVVLVASAAAGWLVAIRWVRSALVAAAVVITGWAVLFEADGALMIGLWAALLPFAMGADRVLAGLHEDRALRTSWRLSIPEIRRVSPATFAGMLAWAAAAGTALADQLNPTGWGSVAPPAVPLTDERALIAAALTATMILAGAIAEAPVLRRAAAVTAIVVVALSVPFELGADLVVVAWTGLAVASVAYVRWDRPASMPMTCLAGALVAAAAVVAFAVVAPPARLVVVDPLVAGRSPLPPLWPLSFAALAAVLLRLAAPSADREVGDLEPARRWRGGRLRGLDRRGRGFPAAGRGTGAARGAGHAGPGRAERHVDDDRCRRPRCRPRDPSQPRSATAGSACSRSRRRRSSSSTSRPWTSPTGRSSSRDSGCCCSSVHGW